MYTNISIALVLAKLWPGDFVVKQKHCQFPLVITFPYHEATRELL